MNKLVVTVGIIALGGGVLHAVESGALNPQQTQKAWSVSSSLRGFYDDNANSQGSGAGKVETSGIQISPSVKYGFAGEQTSLNLGYDFTAIYYDKAVNGGDDKNDYTHNFNAIATHAFSDRVSLNANESFVIGQEPDLQRGNIDNPERVSGNNFRNYAGVGANVQVTDLVGLGVRYNNTVVDYEDEGNFSNSARLDRIEQGISVDSQWVLSPQSIGILGVRFGRTDYSHSSELIDPNFPVYANERNSRSLVINTGVEHEFNDTLSGSFLVGAQRMSYPVDSSTSDKWGPWLESSLRYQMQTETMLEVGTSYSRSASDVVSASSATDFVLDTEVAALYTSLTHKIAPHLTGSGTARFQNITYNGGSVDGDSDQFLLLGLGLAYEFNPNLDGNVGYNFDNLSSDIPGRSYDRNKVYVGVTAKY